MTMITASTQGSGLLTHRRFLPAKARISPAFLDRFSPSPDKDPTQSLQEAPCGYGPKDGEHGAGHLSGKLRVNGLEGGGARPGEPALLEIDFQDPQTGRRLVDFEMEHEKLLHTLIVSDDLSSYAHVHPQLVCDGTFRIGINQPNNDPDSQGAVEAINKPGRYIVFNEVKPTGQETQQVRLKLEAPGPSPLSPSISLLPDEISPNGSIRKFFDSNGNEGDPGATYQVTLSRSKPDGDSPMLHFHFNLQTAHHGAHYQPIENVEPWLGMQGHAVMIGANGNWDEKEFRHLHAGGHGQHKVSTPPPSVIMDGGHPPHDPPGHGSGPDFTFMLEDVPPDGVYKIWAQFKHEGKIRTFPFIVQL